MKVCPFLMGALSWVALSLPVTGQSVDVTLNGVVRDATGAVLPGVTVAATNCQTRAVRAAVTDTAGRYTLLALPAGAYDVQAALAGFATQIRREQTFYVGTIITIDFTLQPAALQEVVEVTSAAPILETTQNTLSRVVQKSEIDTLPVINRNFNDLAALAPGVTKTGLYGGVDISGSRDYQNSYQVDGLSSKEGRLGRQRISYSQDWIQEFQVLTNQFNAEFGQASGGVLNAITRSGGNQWSGRLYGFFRNEALNATPAFTTIKPPLDEKRLGGTLGGPLRRDRIFFFAGFEGFANRASNIVNTPFPSANGVVPATDNQKLFMIKLDDQATATHRIHFRYNTQRRNWTGDGVGGINTEEFGFSGQRRPSDVSGSWNWSPSPMVLNEFRVGYNTYWNNTRCNYAQRHPLGTWFERRYPTAEFGCLINFGLTGEKVIQIVENVSWSRGNHEIKAGFQTQRIRSYDDFRNRRDGQYIFDRDIPFSLDNPASYPYSFTIIFGPTTWSVAGWSFGFFVQDSWKLRPDFTLNLGLRYDVDGYLTALNPLMRLDKGLHKVNKDLNNVAPRVGFAWTPFHDKKKTLLRGGVGIYYDQNHTNLVGLLMHNTINVDRQVMINANIRLQNPFWPDRTRARRFLAEAYARNTIPDTTGLDSVGLANDVDRNLQIPGTLQVTAGIAHDFLRGVSLSADLVYARGFDQLVNRDTNIDPLTLQAINPNYNVIRTHMNGGYFSYKALQVMANFTPGTRYLLKLAYTLAKNESNTASALQNAGVATNPFDLSEDKGPTDNDVRHTLSMNSSVRLPLGVQASGILSFRSALPYSATTPDPRPDGKPFGWRPEPRNARRGDSFTSLDMRLAKIFKLGEQYSISGFVEGFNLTNTVNRFGYVSNIKSASFGQATQAEPKRRMQLGFRLDF